MNSRVDVNLEEIGQISQEVADVVRAGLPLEGTASVSGSRAAEKMHRLMTAVSEQLRLGKSSREIIAGSRGDQQLVTAAVVAGIRTGNLAAAVEMLGSVATELSSLRRTLYQAMAYPVSVLLLAWILFSAVLRDLLHHCGAALLALSPQKYRGILDLLRWDTQYSGWVWVPPACVGLLFLLNRLSVGFGRASFGGFERLLMFIPGVSGALRDLRAYTLGRFLTLLLHRGLPLDESLELAGAMSGQPQWRIECSRLAAQIRTGGSLSDETLKPGRRFPPLLAAGIRFAASSGATDSSVPENGATAAPSTADNIDSMRATAGLPGAVNYYQRRLQRRAYLLKQVIPTLAYLLIAGGAAVLYSLAAFLPVASMYEEMADLSFYAR